jgi:hypothetical protein
MPLTWLAQDGRRRQDVIRFECKGVVLTSILTGKSRAKGYERTAL